MKKIYTLRLNDALLQLNNAVKMQRIAMRFIGHHLGADVAMCRSVSTNTTTAKKYNCYIADKDGGYHNEVALQAFFDLVDGLPHNKVSQINNVNNEPLLTQDQKDICRAADVQAILSVPLIIKGECVWYFSVHCHTPRKWVKGDIFVLKETAGRVWDAIRRAVVEESLRISERKYRALFHKMDQPYEEGIIIRDGKNNPIDYRIITANTCFETLLNLPQGTAAGLTAYGLMPDMDSTRLAFFDRIVQTGESGDLEFEVKSLQRWYSVHAYATGGDCFASIYDDITDRRHARESLVNLSEVLGQQVEDRKRQIVDMKVQQEMNIVKTTFITLEEERKRIADNLHNGLGQLLYGVLINLTNLSGDVPHTDFAAHKAVTIHLLQNVIEENRRLSHELMPTGLEEYGLRSAINDICEQLNGTVAITCSYVTAGNPLDKYLKLALYRMVQELMMNVIKHAQATEANVTVIISKQTATLKVRDNGKGMKTDSRNQGIGLPSIKSKVELLKGNITIGPNGNSGTLVKVTIPLP